jgi:1-deoxy-D-xylulose-5-phosphate reductoisomerase
MRDVVILGSTGSIGVQALEIIDANPGQFRVVALTAAGNNVDLLVAQAKKFKVSVVGVTHNADLVRLGLPGVSKSLMARFFNRSCSNYL